MRAWFAYRDFDHFLTVIRAVAQCPRTVDDHKRVVYEYGAELANHNVRYTEIASPARGSVRDLFHGDDPKSSAGTGRFWDRIDPDFRDHSPLRRPATLWHNAERGGCAAGRSIRVGCCRPRRDSAQQRAAPFSRSGAKAGARGFVSDGVGAAQTDLSRRMI